MLHIHSQMYISLGLLIATWAGVVVTFFMVRTQNSIARMNSFVTLEYQLEDNFNGERKKMERKKLAEQLKNKSPYVEIQDDVIDFFDMVGTLLRRNAIDEELVYTGLSFFIIRWWKASKEYILSERESQGNDNTLFTDFEKLYNRMVLFEMKVRKISKETIELEPIDRFLNDESNLSRV